jgi:hypothetical protein
MAKSNEKAAVASDDNADVVVLSREEYEQLIALRDDPTAGVNLTPAVEEGPHLRNKEVRQAKVQQLREAHESGDIDSLLDGTHLPSDMLDLMDEAGV